MPNPSPARQLEITDRRKRVATMITAGVSYRQIAEREGVSLGTVASDKAAILREWQEVYIEDLGGQLLIDLRRIDNLIERLELIMQEQGTELDPRIGILYLRALERRAKIMGFDARDRRDFPIEIPYATPAIDVAHGEVLLNGRPVGKGAAARLYALFASDSESETGQTEG